MCQEQTPKADTSRKASSGEPKGAARQQSIAAPSINGAGKLDEHPLPQTWGAREVRRNRSRERATHLSTPRGDVDEKLLHLPKQLHPILFEHNYVRALCELDNTSPGAVGECFVERSRATGGRQPVPLGNDD